MSIVEFEKDNTRSGHELDLAKNKGKSVAQTVSLRIEPTGLFTGVFMS